VTQMNPKPAALPGAHRKTTWVRRHVPAVTCAALVLGTAVIVAAARIPTPVQIRSGPVRYLGVYERDAPSSYTSIDQFAQAVGKQPNLAPYYSAWREPFQVGFATSAAKHGAAPLVQINPRHVRLAAIASGKYDAYLRAYAAAVRSYSHPVVMSFGHEMNGSWFPWGYQHTSPAVFVAAWRHIVTLFRTLGVTNVTWLWTINIVNTRGGIPPPAPWWPGGAYVNWVGIDGYYFKPSWTFAPLFGPTIKTVRALTHDPILIAETGAAPAAGKPAKIANLFAGIRAYGLMGFVWFNANSIRDWRINSPAAIKAFRLAAKAYKRRVP
jgi:mannan endo-1,4-beta-mannosidase